MFLVELGFIAGVGHPGDDPVPAVSRLRPVPGEPSSIVFPVAGSW
jgi:hypothetical protein